MSSINETIGSSDTFGKLDTLGNIVLLGWFDWLVDGCIAFCISSSQYFWPSGELRYSLNLESNSFSET